MDEKLKSTVTEMRSIADDVRARFGALAPQQIDWKPSPDSWSVGQCLDHLIRSNVEFDDEFPKLAAKTRKNTVWETWSPLTRFWGWLLISSLKRIRAKRRLPQNL